MAATADEVRTKVGVSATDWPDATLEGKLFILAGDAWLEERLEDAGLTYAELETNQATFADHAEICFIAAKVCEVEARKAAAAGSEFKAGPVAVKGVTADGWRQMSKDLTGECERWAGMAGFVPETKGWGFAFTTADFGDRTEHDYYTTPDELTMLDPNRAEDT